MPIEFAPAVAACLTYPDQPPPDVLKAAQRILGEGEFAQNPPPSMPSREQVQALNNEIQALLDGVPDQIALVYGGATKIKGYVFEAPRLPEIRGASALLDWVNVRALRQLWIDQLGPRVGADLAAQCILVATGGTFLAFAPAAVGPQLAAAVEACYAEHTLTANSVAVAQTFSLLELRYGRAPLDYWVDQFRTDWSNEELSPFLASYYYPKTGDASPEARFYQRKTFGELVTLLASAANRRRESRGDERPEENPRRRVVGHTPLRPWAAKCASSDVRPAVVAAPQPDGDERRLSESSARKLFVGQRMKQTDDDRKWFPQALGYTPQVVGELARWQGLRPDALEHTPTVTDAEHEAAATAWMSWEDRFRLHLHQNEPAGEYLRMWREVGKARPAQDIGEIAQASELERYIGLIYADGNNVGRRLATLTNPGDYTAFGRKMDHDINQAVFTALASKLRPTEVQPEHGPKRFVHPFEIITVGGDDVLLIVPGSAALDIALTLAYTFERTQAAGDSARQPFGRYALAMDNGYDFGSYTPSLGLSAGVVIAPETTPIFFLRDLAEELLKNAKGKVRGHPEWGGALDFMVLKSVTMVTDKISTFRDEAYGSDDPGVPRGTARPYLWPEVQGLLHSARQLAPQRFPRSQLYRLRERLLAARHEGGIAPSMVDYLHTAVSGLRPDARERLLKTMLAWGSTAANRNVPPWLHRAVEVKRRNGSVLALNAWETVLPDIVEVAEFVGDGADG
jgi:CRISPR-associated protein Cmr2